MAANPLEGVSKEDFEYIQKYNKRPENMDFNQFKSIQKLINKMTKKRKGQLIFNSMPNTKTGPGKTYKKNDLPENP